MNHTCDVLIGTCIDFRFQEYINRWISENFPPKSFDRVAIAGGVKDLEFTVSQVEIAHRLHHIKKVVFINHEDCGAYGEENIPDKEAELLRHNEDLQTIADRVRSDLPSLAVETYYLHLNGTFEVVK